MPRKVRVGENDLKTWCLDHNAESILYEWDRDKNGDMTPDLITYASNKVVWWECPRGHSYSMKITVRTQKGCQCPYCSNRRLLKGYNDFQSWCIKNGKEEILKEWNYEKNGKVQPFDIMPGSATKVWWVCRSCGYEWQCELFHRTAPKNAYMCPQCATKKRADLQRVPIIGENDLATTNPELLSEWDYEKNVQFTPQTIKAGSGYKVWWRCSNGHSYQVAPLYKTKGRGCPICAKEIRSSFPEQSVFYYMKKYFPDTINTDRKVIGKELDMYIPSKKTAVEYDGVQWHRGEAAYKKEEVKDLLCVDKGIRMIRIRERGLSYHDNSICIFRENNNTNKSLSETIISVLKTIDSSIFYDVDIDRDITEIYNQITYSQKEHSIVEEFPDIAAEWDYDKNKTLMPSSIVSGSSKMIWWKCREGHSWKALVSSRTKGNGCPYCSNHKVLTGFNDLLTIVPNLAAEWDYEKNGSVLPENVLAGSGHKYWWKCKQNHPSWYVSVDARRSGDGCPYCSGRLAIPGETDIKTTRPDLAATWDYEKNSATIESVKANSNLKFWWKCSKGHSWKATPNSRREGNGCPYCSGHRVIVGETDLLTVRPELIKEWDFEKNIISPSEVTVGSKNKVWWKCSNNHSWMTSINVRTRGRGCPYCANKAVIKGYNDLSTTNPDIANEWNVEKNGELSPSDVLAGSDKKVWWKCKNGHEWIARIANRIHGRQCPYCSGRSITPGVTDLASTHPGILKEWDYEKNSIKPTDVTKGSEKKAWWICEKGHSWEATIASRASGNKCPYCSNKLVLPGYNDLVTLRPELVIEWDYDKNDISPQDVMPGSTKRVFWKCEKGHSWNTAVRVRSRGSNCPICAKNKTKLKV